MKKRNRPPTNYSSTVDLVLKGLSIREIAKIECVTEKAIKHRLKQIFTEAGVRTRYEFMAQAIFNNTRIMYVRTDQVLPIGIKNV